MMKLPTKCVKGFGGYDRNSQARHAHQMGYHDCNYSRFATNFLWSTDFAKLLYITSRHRVVLDELDLLQTDPRYVQSLSKEFRAYQFFESFRAKDIMPWPIDYIFAETMYREGY